MAIETVRFEMGTIEQEDQVWETTGPLPDEMIAQRLAMIPIPTRHDDSISKTNALTVPNLLKKIEDVQCVL